MLKPAILFQTFTFVLLSALPVTAQGYATDKGSIRIGGSGNFSSSKSEGAENRTTILDLRPDVQYFVAPGLALGGELSLTRSSNGDASNTLVGIGPIASYYFGGAERTQPFVSARLGVSQATFGGDDLTQTSMRGAAGLLMLLSSSVGVSSELFYSYTRVEFAGTGDSNSNNFGLALGIAAFLF